MRSVLDAAPAGLGVAVSGGSDSLALLLLCVRWAEGRPVAAATIDHRLRPESVAEAAGVAAFCHARGIPHDTLVWQPRPPRGNLQMAAREARRALLGDWARRRGLGAVALGHTLDDQAETVLQRLARGSGVDGLAGMAPVIERDGLRWLRPMLGLRRAALRDWLRAEGLDWIDDPSNADPAFQRTRARTALAALAPLGLTAERLARTAARMTEARAALEADVRALAHVAAVASPAGEVRLDPAALAGAPREIGLRLLAAAVMWAAGARYRPRLASLDAVHAAIAGRAVWRGGTLAGAVLRPVRGGVAVRREPARAAPPVALGQGTWDGRWRLADGVPQSGLLVGALGEAGLATFGDWRAVTSEARETLLTTPAVWSASGALMAAPLLEADPRWRFRRVAPVAPPWEEPAGLAGV